MIHYRYYILILLTITLSLFISTTPEAQQNKKYTIAIFNLEPQGVSNIEANVLSDKFRYFISKEVTSNEYINKFRINYKLVERTEMNKILGEHEFSSCVSDSCALEFGKILSADRVILGSVGKIGETYTVSARMIDVNTAETLGTASNDYRGDIDEVLNTVLKKVSDELMYGAKNIVLAINKIDEKIKNPRKAFLLSLIPPNGWGQLYNEQKKKSIIINSIGFTSMGLGFSVLNDWIRGSNTYGEDNEIPIFVSSAVVYFVILIFSPIEAYISSNEINQSFSKSTYIYNKGYNITLDLDKKDLYKINFTYRF